MIRVKICGIRSLPEAMWAVKAGADALGFVFATGSKRYVEPQAVWDMTARIPPFVARVGVFVNTPPAEVEEIARTAGLTGIQLHGDEDPHDYRWISLPLIKAMRVPAADIRTDLGRFREWSGLIQAILLDSVHAGQFGGTGRTLPWDSQAVQAWCMEVKEAGIPLILAGGLTADNVSEGITTLEPDAVDVSSGVEKEGRKNKELIREFVRTVKEIGNKEIF